MECKGIRRRQRELELKDLCYLYANNIVYLQETKLNYIYASILRSLNIRLVQDWVIRLALGRELCQGLLHDSD